MRPCDVPLPAGSPTLLCPEPKMISPKTGRVSTLCAWHRLARTPMEAQVRSATQRREATPIPNSRARVPASEWPAGTRWCAGCQNFVPLWYTSGSQCRACAYVARRDARNTRVYGLGRDGFDALMTRQDGRCAICGTRSLDRSIATDHDHKTGETRGLLCKRCNHDLLGAGFDSIRRLRAAVYYLEHPPATDGTWSTDTRNAVCDRRLT